MTDLSRENDFIATSCRANNDNPYLIRLVFSCGPKDGLVTIEMTKADFHRDFVAPLQRLDQI